MGHREGGQSIVAPTHWPWRRSACHENLETFDACRAKQSAQGQLARERYNGPCLRKKVIVQGSRILSAVAGSRIMAML